MKEYSIYMLIIVTSNNLKKSNALWAEDHRTGYLLWYPNKKDHKMGKEFENE